MGRIIGYARVSTQEQADDHNALKQQIHRLEQFGVDEIYQDIQSGANAEREAFTQLLDLVKQGEVETIVATRWDRLTRQELLYLELKAILRASNTKLQLLDQGEVDLSTAFGELSADMQAMFAVHERRMLRERVQRGFDFRRTNQVAWTRAPWGYVIKDDKYVLDTEPIICLLAERPENYLDLSAEPDTSPLLLGISKSQIAREAIEVFLQLRRTRQVLKYLYLKYGVGRKKGTQKRKKDKANSEKKDKANSEEKDQANREEKDKANSEKKDQANREEKDKANREKKRNKGTNLVLSKELLFWSAGGHFKEWLENPVLRGHTAYKKYKKKGSKKDPEFWEMHLDTHADQRLMTDEELQEIQAILKSNARQVGAPKATFYLTGLVVCDRCGHKCVLKRSPHYQYYGCRNSTIGCNNRKCIRIEKIDEAIINQLVFRANELLVATDELQEESLEPAELILLKEQLKELEKILQMNPKNDIFKKTKYDLIKEIESQSRQVDGENFIQATARQIIHHPEARKKTFWYTLTREERDVIYDKLLRKVAILDGDIVSVNLSI